MDTTFIVGLIIAALASGAFLYGSFLFVRTIRTGLAADPDSSDADFGRFTTKLLWVPVGMVPLGHFTILNISETSAGGIEGVTNNALVVIDTMAKGVLLDLFESFDISLGHFEPEPQWAFAYSILLFVSRTFYSMAFVTLALVYGTRLARWWKARS